MGENKSKGLSNFGKIVIGEIIVLLVVLVLCRIFIFPAIGGRMDMLHIQIATHTIMTGICATIFSVFAIVVKKKIKTHKKYIIIPVIFTLFGFLMHMLAEEISVII